MNLKRLASLLRLPSRAALILRVQQLFSVGVRSEL